MSAEAATSDQDCGRELDIIYPFGLAGVVRVRLSEVSRLQLRVFHSFRLPEERQNVLTLTSGLDP